MNEYEKMSILVLLKKHIIYLKNKVVLYEIEVQ